VTNTVNGQFAFSPKKTKISVGTKVTWTNVSDAPHTVTGKGSWKFNKTLNMKASISYTFKKAGTYKYYCTYHPYMVGTIVVK
jgi:plastocyanin